MAVAISDYLNADVVCLANFGSLKNKCEAKVWPILKRFSEIYIHISIGIWKVINS